MTRDEQREYNRRQFPELAAFVDDCRRVFGEGVRVLSLEVIPDSTAGFVKWSGPSNTRPFSQVREKSPEFVQILIKLAKQHARSFDHQEGGR